MTKGENRVNIALYEECRNRNQRFNHSNRAPNIQLEHPPIANEIWPLPFSVVSRCSHSTLQPPCYMNQELQNLLFL